MRITCGTVEGFLKNLEGGDVFERTVWVDKTTRRISEAVVEITFQSSAVIVFAGGGDALVQYGEICGMDYDDGETDSGGSEAEADRRRKIEDWCAERGVSVRPGLIDV